MALFSAKNSFVLRKNSMPDERAKKKEISRRAWYTPRYIPREVSNISIKKFEHRVIANFTNQLDEDDDEKINGPFQGY